MPSRLRWQTLSPRERDAIVAHELEGVDTSALADEWGTSPGAVAAQLSRARAKLRVEYLLAAEGEAPPTPQCRPVLFALSSGDRRRQAETDAGHHLLDCDFCGGRERAPARAPRQDDGE